MELREIFIVVPDSTTKNFNSGFFRPHNSKQIFSWLPDFIPISCITEHRVVSVNNKDGFVIGRLEKIPIRPATFLLKLLSQEYVLNGLRVFNFIMQDSLRIESWLLQVDFA